MSLNPFASAANLSNEDIEKVQKRLIDNGLQLEPESIGDSYEEAGKEVAEGTKEAQATGTSLISSGSARIAGGDHRARRRVPESSR